MIWQENVEQVVMLTNLMEGTKVNDEYCLELLPSLLSVRSDILNIKIVNHVIDAGHLPFVLFCFLICCVYYVLKNHVGSFVIDFLRQSVYSIGQILK